MKIKVIHSCDDNPYYLNFWPLVSMVWKKIIGYDPVLIHIGDSNIDSTYGEVVSLKEIKSIPIHTQAQLARLWYPSLEPDVLWITSDIDMFPMSKPYWNSLKEYFKVNGVPDWTNLNSSGDYFPICYNVAYGEKFKLILEIAENFEDYLNYNIENDFEKTTHTPENWTGPPMTGWNMDEIVSSRKISNFRNNGGVVFAPPRPPGRRIDRINWNYDKNLVESGYYIDCHSLRPVQKYEKEIKEVLGLLK